MARAGRKTLSATQWMRENWRPLAAFIYLSINVFDFIIAPIFMGITNETTAQFVQSIMGLDPSVQAILAQKPNNGWQPLTLMGSGMFHISFGAILGVSAWSRGSEKAASMREEAYTHAVNQLYPKPKEDYGFGDQYGGQQYGGQQYGGQQYGGQQYGGPYYPQAPKPPVDTPEGE